MQINFWLEAGEEPFPLDSFWRGGHASYFQGDASMYIYFQTQLQLRMVLYLCSLNPPSLSLRAYKIATVREIQ